MNDDTRFGHSLALVDGDLAFDADGKLLTVRGKANLLQALQLRILTPFASDRFNATYGIDVRQAFTEPHGPRVVKELIRLNLVRTLATDPRVREVQEVVFVDDPEFAARHPDLSPGEASDAARNARHRRIWTVEVVVETVDGQTAAVPAQVGV